LRSDNFDSVGELPKDDLGELAVNIETSPAFFAASASLKIMASAVAQGPAK
jgi:hypothetical protein